MTHLVETLGINWLHLAALAYIFGAVVSFLAAAVIDFGGSTDD